MPTIIEVYVDKEWLTANAKDRLWETSVTLGNDVSGIITNNSVIDGKGFTMLPLSFTMYPKLNANPAKYSQINIATESMAKGGIKQGCKFVEPLIIQPSSNSNNEKLWLYTDKIQKGKATQGMLFKDEADARRFAQTFSSLTKYSDFNYYKAEVNYLLLSKKTIEIFKTEKKAYLNKAKENNSKGNQSKMLLDLSLTIYDAIKIPATYLISPDDSLWNVVEFDSRVDAEFIKEHFPASVYIHEEFQKLTKEARNRNVNLNEELQNRIDNIKASTSSAATSSTLGSRLLGVFGVKNKKTINPSVNSQHSMAQEDETDASIEMKLN